MQTGLIILGIMLRLRHYAENRSFWQDEICLALSIVNRSWQEIWQHVLLFPDFAQAPLFFQLIEKAVVALLGNSELALRFFPLAAGIGALFLARRFFRRTLDPAAATLALALFAVIEPPVYFAAELKPYGVDLLAALAVYEMFLGLKENWTARRIVLFALGGALIIWLSNAMLFILAGCGAVMFVEKTCERDLKKAVQLLLCYALWAASFFLLYHLSVGRMLNPDLLKNWRLTGGFAPAPIWTLEGVRWAWRVFIDMFRSPLGLGWPYLMAVFFGAGCYGLWRRDKRMVALLLTPFALTLLAAAFEKYPFFERLVLFLVPALLVVIAQGARDIAVKAGGWKSWMAAAVVAVVLALPVVEAARHVVTPRGQEENREAMIYLAAHYQPGDMIAVSPQAQYPFWYYGQRFGLNQRLPMHRVGPEGAAATPVIQLFPDIIVNGGARSLALRRTLSIYDAAGHYRKFMVVGRGEAVMVSAASPQQLQGMGRVWVFLSHHNDPEYPAFVQGVFSAAGSKIDDFQRPGVALMLYNIPKGS